MTGGSSQGFRRCFGILPSFIELAELDGRPLSGVPVTCWDLYWGSLLMETNPNCRWGFAWAVAELWEMEFWVDPA